MLNTTFRSLLPRLAALALAAAAPSLSAAGKATLDLHLRWVSPQGDLKTAVDDKAGIAGETVLLFDLGSGNRLGPYFGALNFPTRTDSVMGVPFQHKLNALTYGVSYQHLFGGGERGFYLTARAGANRWKAEGDEGGVTVSNSTVVIDKHGYSATTTRFAAAAGAGWLITSHVGVEAVYETSSFSKDLNADSLQAGLRLHF